MFVMKRVTEGLSPAASLRARGSFAHLPPADPAWFPLVLRAAGGPWVMFRYLPSAINYIAVTGLLSANMEHLFCARTKLSFSAPGLLLNLFKQLSRVGFVSKGSS